ncbi:hypothetical protein MNV49_003402 [Pseudohyphozyma bogoriensis]|nr:hypothetical protein MNV49_003402 [Pseudohyphozyma bogoriensis]
MPLPSLRPLIPRSPATIAFLAVTFLETVVDIAIVAVLLHSFEQGFVKTVLAKTEKSVLPVYLGLFVLAHVFQLLLAVDALTAKNTLQIVGLCVFNTLFLVYAIIQIIEIKLLISGRALKILVWFIPGMIAVTELTYLVTFWPIFQEFGWQIYKRIGADRRIKKCFMWYQVFVCILKFDVFLFVAFTLQLILLVNQNDLERWLTIAAIPITIAFLALGLVAVRTERAMLYWGFLAGCVAGTAYFVYKQLFRIYQDRLTDYVLVYKSLTVFAALCFAAILWTSITSWICFRNFGRGLKQQMRKVRNPVHGKLEDGGFMLQSANNSRMSID